MSDDLPAWHPDRMLRKYQSATSPKVATPGIVWMCIGCRKVAEAFPEGRCFQCGGANLFKFPGRVSEFGDQ